MCATGLKVHLLPREDAALGNVMGRATSVKEGISSLRCRDVSLEVTGLSKRYGTHDAMNGVDVCVAPGEIHGLLGRNGAGKTTLLRVLLGLATADAGAIDVDGVVLGAVPVALPDGVAGFAGG